MAENIVEWPWPRIFATKYRMLGIHKLEDFDVYLLLEVEYDGTNWGFFHAGTIAAPLTSLQFSVADFGPFYVWALNAVDNNETLYISTLIRDIEEDTANACLIEHTQPAFGTCCNFNGQLIGGNIYSPSIEADNYWAGLGTNAIVWSAIANFEFDPAQDKTAGFSEGLFDHVNTTRASIYRIMPLSRGPVVYSDAGICLLVPSHVSPSFTYGKRYLKSLGIRNGNHAAGSDYIHGFIDTACNFWLLFDNGELTNRGYREWIVDLVTESDQLIVSYLERQKRFYISNGTSCLIINEFGAYKAHQRVSSVVQTYDNVLFGTYSDNADLVARTVTDTLDYGSRGIKSVESLVAQLSIAEATTARFAVDWRVSNNAEFRRSVLKTGGPTGEANVGVAALDFRLVMECSTYVDTYLTQLRANVKFSDQRFKRGTAPAQFDTRMDQ